MNVRNFTLDRTTDYILYESQDCDQVDPVKYFGNIRKVASYHTALMRIQNESSYKTLSAGARIELTVRIKALAKQQWDNEYESIITTPLAESILQLLEERKKKAQQKLVRKMIFDSSLLIGIPIHAWLTHKMPFSRYTASYQAKEFQNKVFPAMMRMKDSGDFDVVGYTDLTKTDMRIAMEKSHRVICDFIGSEDHWYCFFRTMLGIIGNEVPHVGEPHLHFISSAWGVSRKDVIDNLTSYRYSLKADTIPFEYRISRI